MMRKWLVGLIALCTLLLLPLVGLTQEDTSVGTLEITGANATALPTITVTANVLDTNNRPILGLGVDDFVLSGDLAEYSRIVQVQNITSDDLAFATVLVIDVSSSMDGRPLQNAKTAAQQFVELSGENDPIAIVAFSTRVRLVQDFTTDKAVLTNAIENLPVGGQTALYDAGTYAVDIAANAPVPRRAVILLSDGAEYGGASAALREDAAARAAEDGISFYTIGLGFGTDRTYLQELADSSNARFYESPAAEQLTEIYTDLATLFRTLYVITLESDVPFDGTTYEFGLQATPEGGSTNVDTGTVRAPIPVPLVSLQDGIFDEPIAAPVVVTPNIAADDDIAGVEVLVNGEAAELVDGSLTIDPLNFAPGSYPLAIRVTDANGDSGSLEAEFEIAALPSTVMFDTTFDAPVVEPQTVTLGAEGQTAATLAGYRVVDANGEVVAEFQSDDVENGFPFTLEPFALAPGDYTLSVDVLNEGGALATAETPFNVGAVAPQNVSISGVEAEQELSEPTTITVDADAQEGVEIANVTVQVGSSLAPLGEDLTIVPFDYPPGPAILTAVVEDANGLTASSTVPIVIAALAPEVSIGEIPENISTPVEVPLEVSSQTRVSEISFQIDEGEAQSLVIVPDQPLPAVPLDAAAIGDGEHTLTVTVSNAGGASTTVSETFTVQLPTPTVAVDMTGTADAVIFEETGTASAVGTLEAQEQANMAATESFQATSEAADAQATTDAEQAALDAQATTDAQSTLDAQATIDAEEVDAEQASLDAQATLDTQSTIDAQQAANEQATVNADAAAADAQATIDAQSTLNAQATLDTQSTIDAQQAANEQATVNADAAAADAQATIDAQSTLDAQATLDTQSTIDAQQAANEQATVNADAAAAAAAADEQATMDAQATLDAEATEEVTEVATEDVAVAPTIAPTEEVTEEATLQPTPTEELPTLTPVGGIVEVDGQNAPPADSNMTALLLVACAGGLLLLLLVLILRGRRQNQEANQR